MKKGFSLIELLIVMVVVGILVTIALPKYNASLERGRSVEALTNLKAASEALNARYVMNNNSYTRSGVVDSNGNFVTGSFTKPRYFGAPKVVNNTDITATAATVTIVRAGDDYTLQANNERGELKNIVCTATDTRFCENIGAEKNNQNVYIMDFVN